MNFWLGGPYPQRGAPSPKLIGALYGHPLGARCSEKTVAIRAAVAEKIDLEEKNLAPSSGETGRGRGRMSRMQSGVLEYYIVLKCHVPRPPRSDVIRLFRNLKMGPMENARHFFGYYIRAPK